jgi:hypothetical protein
MVCRRNLLTSRKDIVNACGVEHALECAESNQVLLVMVEALFSQALFGDA